MSDLDVAAICHRHPGRRDGAGQNSPEHQYPRLHARLSECKSSAAFPVKRSAASSSSLDSAVSCVCVPGRLISQRAHGVSAGGNNVVFL